MLIIPAQGGFVYIDNLEKNEYNVSILSLLKGTCYMKKVFALLLAVLTVVLTACGTQPDPVATPDTPPAATPDTAATPDEPVKPTEVTQPTTLANDRFDPEASAAIIGQWTAPIILDGAMFNLTDMEATVEMTLIYQLCEDGTYFRGVPQEEYHTAIADYNEAVKQFLIDRFYATFTAEKLIEGVSKKKINTLWEETQKANAEEQAERFVEGLYLDYRFSQLNGSGDYYVEDGVIWFSQEDRSYEPCSFTLSEEGLTITEVKNTKLYKQLGLELPLLLTKA